jgi:hypothetical protein
MSDMSFKQAKELVEKMELVELSLKNTISDVNDATAQFKKSLFKQQNVIDNFPKIHTKLNILRFIVALNIGFVVGVFVGKYFF